jgi:hypothetical protein
VQHSTQGMQASRFTIHVDLQRNNNPSHLTAAAGCELGVHNSLKPLKLGKRRSSDDGDGAIGVAPSSGLEADSEEHVLPGGVGTFSIRQVASATQSSHGVVRGAFPPAVHVSRTVGPPHGTESGARAHSGPATMWQDSGMDQRSRGKNCYLLHMLLFCSLGLDSAFQNSDPPCMFRRERRGGEKQKQRQQR